MNFREALRALGVIKLSLPALVTAIQKVWSLIQALVTALTKSKKF